MRRWKRGRWRAHPRSRGADPSYAAARALDTGSSPLARGGRADAGAEGQPDGLIPARAGRTLADQQQPTGFDRFPFGFVERQPDTGPPCSIPPDAQLLAPRVAGE